MKHTPDVGRTDRGAAYAVDSVVRSFRLPRTSLAEPPPRLLALRGVSVRIEAGETFAIVGESGSGKSTLVRVLLALDRPDSGSVRCFGEELVDARESRLRGLRRRVQPVFQDPGSSLDPRMRVNEIIREPLRSLRVEGDHAQRVHEVLEAVGLSSADASRYPHQFSGGQRQRIAIARALAPRPDVIIADEPVSALDVSVRAQILNLLHDLRQRYGLTLVLVSHDLSVVRTIADRVAVMYLGRIVETGAVETLFTDAQHPYTRLLLRAVPTLDGPPPRPLRGAPPSARAIPSGCAFHPRCPLAFDRCRVDDPALTAPAATLESANRQHEAACHLAFSGRVESV